MQSAHEPRLSMAGIGKRFGATVALDAVDLEVRAGEVHALVGENGAGKSTLMRVLAGALSPDTGRMRLDGQAYAPRTPSDARRAGVAMIYQELSIAPHLTVAENVLLGAEPRRGWLIDGGEHQRRARRVLERVGRAELALEQTAGELGIADLQLIEIARALALQARVVVLDEPTSSLGRADVERLFALIRALQSEGTSVVYISHLLEEVFELAQRITVLRDGRAVETLDTCATTPARLVAAMVGREVSALYPRSQATPGEVLASVRDVAGVRSPKRAALELRRGEVLGIAGLVGSGRTELLRALFGLDAVARGELRIAHVEGPRTPRERWHGGVGFAPEDRKRESLALARPISENLCLPRLDRVASLGWLRPGSIDARAAPWIEALGVKCTGPGQVVARLSGGNQQKVALARLLFAEVDLFLLDEPTRGVDVGAKAEIYRLIDELAHVREPHKAVLVVSSYLPELFGICDRIAVMSRGVLHPARPVDQLDEHDVMALATGSAA